MQAIFLVGEDLTHHIDERPAISDKQALLAVGRKAHVPGLERGPMRSRDRLFAKTLHVERGLALTLREQHPRVEGPRQHHVAQSLALFVGVERPRPFPDCFAVVVKHADHRIGEIADLGRADVDRRTRNFAWLRNADMAEIGAAAGAYARLGHMQRKAGGAGHQEILRRRCDDAPRAVSWDCSATAAGLSSGDQKCGAQLTAARSPS